MQKHVKVLSFYAALRIQHQDADIGVLNGPDGTHDGIIFQIFRHLVFTADTGRIHQIEIKPELGITGVNGVPGGSGDIGHDVTFSSDKRVDQAGLACIRSPDNGKTGDILIRFVIGSFREF